MARTRIYRNVKIDCDGFNTESTNSKATVLLERFSNARDEEQNSQAYDCYRSDDVYDARRQSKFLRNDKRAESDRDAGSGTAGRLFVKLPNPGQTHCESLSTARRTGPNRL